MAVPRGHDVGEIWASGGFPGIAEDNALLHLREEKQSELVLIIRAKEEPSILSVRCVQS